MGKHLTEAEKSLAFAMRTGGSTIKEISANLGRHYQTVYGLLNERQKSRVREASRRWHKEHPDWAKNYHRLHVAVTKDRKYVCGINRRPRPEMCELCRRNSRWLLYHHWSDDAPDVGVWLCTPCHRLAEAIDAGVSERIDEYLGLKQEAAEEVACRSAVKLRDRALQLKSKLNGGHIEL